MKKPVQETKEHRKVLVAGFAILILYLMIEPKVLISNIRKPEIILGSLYSEVINICFGYFLVYVFRRKSDTVTAILTFICAMLLDCFVEVTYESEFIQQNLALVIAVSAFTVFVLSFVWFQERIFAFLDKHANYTIKAIVIVIFFAALITMMVLFIIHYVRQIRFYGFRWTNIQWE